MASLKTTTNNCSLKKEYVCLSKSATGKNEKLRDQLKVHQQSQRTITSRQESVGELMPRKVMKSGGQGAKDRVKNELFYNTRPTGATPRKKKQGQTQKKGSSEKMINLTIGSTEMTEEERCAFQRIRYFVNYMEEKEVRRVIDLLKDAILERDPEKIRQSLEMIMNLSATMESMMKAHCTGLNAKANTSECWNRIATLQMQLEEAVSRGEEDLSLLTKGQQPEAEDCPWWIDPNQDEDRQKRWVKILKEQRCQNEEHQERLQREQQLRREQLQLVKGLVGAEDTSVPALEIQEWKNQIHHEEAEGDCQEGKEQQPKEQEAAEPQTCLKRPRILCLERLRILETFLQKKREHRQHRQHQEQDQKQWLEEDLHPEAREHYLEDLGRVEVALGRSKEDQELLTRGEALMVPMNGKGKSPRRDESRGLDIGRLENCVQEGDKETECKLSEE